MAVNYYVNKTERTHFLNRVSLCGVDDNIPIELLSNISRKYPFIEWGILYMPTKQGQQRYPSQTWRISFFQYFFEHVIPVQSAIHLCGKEAFHELMEDRLPKEIFKANRLQLNINARGPDFTTFEVMQVFRKALKTGMELILQYHKQTAEVIHFFLSELSSEDKKRVHILMDESRGFGIVPTTKLDIPDEVRRHYFGVAGGINSTNTEQVIGCIEQYSQPFWIDMESGIRTNNEFDVEEAIRVLEVAKQYCR